MGFYLRAKDVPLSKFRRHIRWDRGPLQRGNLAAKSAKLQFPGCLQARGDRQTQAAAARARVSCLARLPQTSTSSSFSLSRCLSSTEVDRTTLQHHPLLTHSAAARLHVVQLRLLQPKHCLSVLFAVALAAYPLPSPPTSRFFSVVVCPRALLPQ